MMLKKRVWDMQEYYHCISQVSSMNCTLVFEACSVVFLWCRCSHTVGLHYFVLRIHCQTSM